MLDLNKYKPVDYIKQELKDTKMKIQSVAFYDDNNSAKLIFEALDGDCKGKILGDVYPLNKESAVWKLQNLYKACGRFDLEMDDSGNAFPVYSNEPITNLKDEVVLCDVIKNVGTNRDGDLREYYNISNVRQYSSEDL